MAKTYPNPRSSKQREVVAARRRQQRIKTIAGAGVAVLIVGLVVVLAVSRSVNKPGETVRDMGNAHIEEGQRSPVAYNSTPPTSGPHYGSLAEWGVHEEPIADELVVHNLEDGGVGVWYDCPDGCPELVTQLTSVVDGYHDGVILAPYPGMDSRIALTAWNRIDKFEAFDEGRIEGFIRAYLGVDHHASR
ncbi:MAG: DUF3105 domain-containing protein [Anaerolineae bacterium]|jgi:hypothetical protein